MKTVLMVFPTAWDEKQLNACRPAWEKDFTIELGQPTDEDCPSDLDILAYIDELVSRYRGDCDGVYSSSDYPGATVAAAVTTRLGLPGSNPEAILRCSHKYYSRIAQRESVPEATAQFCLVVPGSANADVTFPCYLKPVKGAFSIMSGKVRSRKELDTFMAKPSVELFCTSYVDIFNRLVRGLSALEIDGSHFLAEELLRGRQATIEGFVAAGEVHLLGIVDSVRHRKTKSFVRFDYPSSLPHAIQERMTDIASRLVAHLELKDTLFNVEMMYDESYDRIAIVEVNPRMCGQFADLYSKVDGTSGYEISLCLATGQEPRIRRGAGSFRAASSYPLRIYEPCRVTRAPSSSDIASVESSFPETLIWNECRRGDLLTDFESEDGKSLRYAVVNIGGSDRTSLRGRFEDVVRRLDYRFEPP